MPNNKLKNTPITCLPIKNTAPDPDCAEISLFGPGIGECIVLHFGHDRWFIIDSCLSPTTKKPIALEYLQGIGVDVARQVEGIIITHWHKDHIEGAATLIKSCHQAKLYLSAALNNQEAFRLASVYNKTSFNEIGEDIAEYKEIIDFIYSRKEKERLISVKTRHTFFDYRDIIPARLVALSPSDAAYHQAIANIVESTPQTGQPRTRNIVPCSPNLNAIAMYFSFGSCSVLLGSDIEKSANPQTGWSAILNNNIYAELSLSKSAVFKVAHHGSQTGHDEQVWQNLLTNLPLAITTPFNRCGLPTPDNIATLSALSSDVLITRAPLTKSKIKRDNLVEKTLRSMVQSPRLVVNDKMGHIQLRLSKDGGFRTGANALVEHYPFKAKTLDKSQLKN